MCAEHVLINEVLLNQVTGTEFVELYNPKSTSQDLSSYELDALGTNATPSLVVKWTGAAGDVIAPHGYFVLEYGTTYPSQGTLQQISKAKDPTVVVLFQSGAVVDSLCVCSNTSGCAFFQGEEFCANRDLFSPPFHSPSNTQSASRTSCADTNNDANDFALECPSAGALNATMQCP